MISHKEIAELNQKNNEKLVQACKELENTIDDTIRKTLTNGDTRFALYLDNVKYSSSAVSSVINMYLKNGILKFSETQPKPSPGGHTYAFVINTVPPVSKRAPEGVQDMQDALDMLVLRLGETPTRCRIPRSNSQGFSSFLERPNTSF